MSLSSVGMNLWIADENGVWLGHGRAKILRLVDELGSLKKAAEHLGMSYRAAWGKIKNAEQSLGCPLLIVYGTKKDGYSLTPRAKELVNSYFRWHEQVLAFAIQTAPQKNDFFEAEALHEQQEQD